MALQDEIRQLNKTLSSEDSRCLPTLPPEIIAQILLILPIESLVSCISVCKLWCSLIFDPHFIKSHLNLSSRNNNHSNHQLIFTSYLMLNLKICPLNDVLFNKSVDKVLKLKLGSPFKQFEPLLSIAGSCNGLVCIDVKGYTPIICNPVLKRSNRIPFGGFKMGQRGCFVMYSFGYDEATDDYKVVRIPRFYKNDNKVEIYSLKTGKWKKIDDFPLGHPLTQYGKFSNGALHWMVTQYHWFKIVSLDLANESFGEVLQPVYDEGHKDLSLGILGDWLCVLCSYGKNHADVWVMKVYGVTDSWTKLVSIPYLSYNRGRFSVPLFISNDEKILLRLGSRLVLYDSRNHSFSEIQDFAQCATESMFVGSLVSPGRCFS